VVGEGEKASSKRIVEHMCEFAFDEKQAINLGVTET